MVICPQPNGGGHEAGGVAVIVAVGVKLGVGDKSPRVGVRLGGRVFVTVSGMGEEIRRPAEVGVTCGTNSTSEMDKAPTINPTDIIATIIALPIPRNPWFCIIYFPWLSGSSLFRRWATAH